MCKLLSTFELFKIQPWLTLDVCWTRTIPRSIKLESIAHNHRLCSNSEHKCPIATERSLPALVLYHPLFFSVVSCVLIVSPSLSDTIFLLSFSSSPFPHFHPSPWCLFFSQYNVYFSLDFSDFRWYSKSIIHNFFFFFKETLKQTKPQLQSASVSSTTFSINIYAFII